MVNGSWLMVESSVWAIEDVRLKFFADSITEWEFFFRPVLIAKISNVIVEVVCQ